MKSRGSNSNEGKSAMRSCDEYDTLVQINNLLRNIDCIVNHTKSMFNTQQAKTVR